MADLKTALLLVRWISEMSEEGITEVMKIGPGDIRSRVDSADWILYAMNEVALIFNPDASKLIRPLLTRVRYGVKEELIPLVSFRGVGRSRARILFDAGIKGRADISRIGEAELAAMPKIGKSLAASLKEQAGYSRETPDEDYRETVDDEMEYMLEKMAAEEEAKNSPQPVEPEPEKKSSGSKKHSQSSLDLF